MKKLKIGFTEEDIKILEQAKDFLDTNHLNVYDLLAYHLEMREIAPSRYTTKNGLSRFILTKYGFKIDNGGRGY